MRPIILTLLLSLFPVLASAFDWSEDFEYGRTFTDAPAKPGCDSLRLTPGPALAEWPDSNGIGALEADDTARCEYFTFKYRQGTLLTGVTNIRGDHPEGADARTTGIARWSLGGDTVKTAQFSPRQSASGGFGIHFFRGAYPLKKDFPECRRIYVRFYLNVKSVRHAAAADTSPLGFHGIQPGYTLNASLLSAQDSFAVLVVGSRFAEEARAKIPLNRWVCVEYEVIMDTVANLFSFDFWLDNRLLKSCVKPVPKNVSIVPFSTLYFAHTTNDRPVSGDYAVDDIMISDCRIGPRAEPPALALKPLPNGRALIVPPDTAGLTGLEVQMALAGEWRFPLFSRKIAWIDDNALLIRHYPFETHGLTLRGRQRRSNTGWSAWSSPVAVTLTDSLDSRRPTVDSMFLTDRLTGKRTDTLVIGRWYDILFYASDPLGFRNLQYNYLFFNSVAFPDCDALNQGGLYDPCGNYFISLSLEHEVNRSLTYVRNKPGTDYPVVLCPSCTSYVDGLHAPFGVDTLRKAWKTNIRLLPQAEPGVWLFQGTVINNQEIPSISLRKKILVTRTFPVEKNNRALLVSTLLGILLIVGAGLFFVRRAKNELPVRELDYRVKLALNFINQTYKKDISIGTVAEKVGANPAWLGRVFKRQVGIGMLSYVNNLRCREASELLKTSEKNIAEIGYAVGFNNPHYFKDVFKKFTGKSPIQYRKAYFPLASPEE